MRKTKEFQNLFLSKMRRLSSEQGLTLLEVMIAAGILAFSLCGILVAFIASFVLSETSKNVNIATNAAILVAEQVRNTPFSKVPNYNNLNFIVNDIPQSRGVVYVNTSNNELYVITISVCWSQRNRVIGEDTNLNGVLNAGEDVNGNGIIDSPVQIVVKMTNTNV